MDYFIDAKNKTLGRLASEIAVILQGKKNPFYEKRALSHDRVIVKNVNQIKVSGKKYQNKIYYRHSGPLGHLKMKKYQEVFLKKPEWVLRHAVYLMLPKNRLRAKRIKNLIFAKEND